MSQQHTLTAHTELGLMLGRLMQVEGTHALVVSWCMVLAEVVAQVGVSWLPVNSELSLFNAVLEPVDLKRKIVQCSELSTQLRV